MIVNDDPGVETRIAILEGGRLEELYTERTKAATGVGNIYKGRVTNVEASIQAAFIEYGGEQSGFLHVTDLHPRYFPGKEVSERVGKKIARHARPPIQQCLKRGDEILIQVMKQGIGTKGPTLTSYLSISGRLTVMMPYMDKVGVSRKIEDEDERRAMRKVIDSLNLPKGFGFILRTAGLGKKSAEVKRDIAYLLRLWKMIEKRIVSIGVPCPLYNESDLLIRTIRDILRPSIGAIVVDSDSAHDKIIAFLKIVAPRSGIHVVRYRQPTPIFHAFAIEHQIEEIHSCEVALPSGGCLVINQTEALVAIDVNSGKSKLARNSEENAFHTNIEAADEICRQLRLRDLGGIVVNDLIDMNSASHRRKIEERFQANLERDRARSTVLPISRFGLIEMTRQRIRPSVLDSHYVPCSHCDGRGHVKTDEEVAADATRHCGWILHYEKVHRVELVCSPSVGTYLLSNKRRELDTYETKTGKRIVVRISEDLASDKVDYHAYDVRETDIDISKLPSSDTPTITSLEKSEKAFQSGHRSQEEIGTGRRRSRRRGKKNLPLADGGLIPGDVDIEEELASLDKPVKKKKPTRRSKPKMDENESPADSAMRVYQFARSLGKSSQEVIELCKSQDIEVCNHMSTLTVDVITKIEKCVSMERPKTDKPKRKRRRRGSKKRVESTAVATGNGTKESTQDKSKSTKISETRESKNDRVSTRKKRSRRSAKKAEKKKLSVQTTKEVAEPKKPRRTLYGGRHRPVTTKELHESMDDR